MQVENVEKIENGGKRAGIILRFIATLLDFFVFFTSVSYFYIPVQGKSKGTFSLLILAAAVLYEISFKNTPGKQLLKMKTIYERKALRFYLLRPVLKYLLGAISVLFKPFNRKRQWLHDRLSRTIIVKAPCRLRPLKAIVFFILGLNIFLTFGLGNLMWGLMKEKIDFDRVNTIPERITVEKTTVPGENFTVWNSGWRMSLPRNFRGMDMENGYGWNGYGISSNVKQKTLGIFIGFMNFNHPCTKCEPKTGNVWRIVLPCDKSPIAVQDAVFNAALKDRLLIWNPLNMLRINSLLFEKSINISGIGNDFSLRKLNQNGISIVWLITEMPPGMELEPKIPFFWDTLFLATPSDYGVLIVLWKGKPRDEQLVLKLIGSLEFRPSGPSDIDEQFELAKKHRSIVHAMNAFRMSEKNRYNIGELLFHLLSEKGTAAEKSSFSLTISSLGKEERRYLKMAYLTREWR